MIVQSSIILLLPLINYSIRLPCYIILPMVRLSFIYVEMCVLLSVEANLCMLFMVYLYLYCHWRSNFKKRIPIFFFKFCHNLVLPLRI